MRFLIIGNCQARSLGDTIGRMSGASVQYLKLLPGPLMRADKHRPLSGMGKGWERIGAMLDEADRVFLQDNGTILQRFESEYAGSAGKFSLFPRIDHVGFHPDMIRLESGLRSPTGALHSSIVCAAWRRGATFKKTLDLFNDEVFEELGFYAKRQVGDRLLQEAGVRANLPLDELLERWHSKGAFMHTMNHPKGFVLDDLARALLKREEIEVVHGTDTAKDPLSRQPSWGVYPEVARRLGIEGSYWFRKAWTESSKQRTFDLPQFIQASFRCYARCRMEDIDSECLRSPRYQALDRFLVPAVHGRRAAAGHARNPYSGLPDHHFWRKAVAALPRSEVDPVLGARFRIQENDRVATAGSCFAQHISRTLASEGFNYYVAEAGSGLADEEARARNYGVFSARYGNIYSVRQLLQLFDRAEGNFSPEDSAWRREDGRFVDPFRPQIEPDGFENPAALRLARREHLAAVRQMFRHLDVFVFTLGLTESWVSRADGAVFPLAPGVAGGKMDAERYEFRNFGVDEIRADLLAFIDRLRTVNPASRIILTVSPVPLIATYEDRHVLVSTTLSKAVLRVVAEEVSRAAERCAYFPSFEIITGNHARGEYFDSDLRSVRPEGVSHVMKLFLRHYAGRNPAAAQDGPQGAPAGLEDDLVREARAVAEVVCDEEAISQGA